MTERETCYHCRWYTVGRNQCRARAPQLGKDLDIFHPRWPRTDWDQSCGEWEPREKESADANAEIADLRAKLEAAERELIEVKSSVGVVPTWFQYRPEDWKECLLSIKRKLGEDTTQIVDMIRELREANAEIADLRANLDAASRDTARLDALERAVLDSLRRVPSADAGAVLSFPLKVPIRQWVDDNLLGSTDGGAA